MTLRGNNQTQPDSNAKRAGGTKERQARAAVIQWLAPITVLLLVIFIMLINFMGKAEKTGQEKVTNIFIGNTEQYSRVFNNELETMTKTMIPLSLLIDNQKGASAEIVSNVASLLEENTDASLVVICGTNGRGLDKNGKHVYLSGEEYFQGLNGNEQQYFWVKEMAEGEGAAIVSAVPIPRGDKTAAYILAYYTTESFGELINKIEHDNETFYAIITEQGEVLVGYGADSVFLKGENLLETLEKAQIYDGSISYARQRLQKYLSGNLSASYKGESRLISYSPLHINGWQFVMGVNQSYADALMKQEVRESRQFIWNLMLVMCVFFALIVAINVFNRVRFNENSKDLEKQADTDLLTGLNNKIATERKIKEYMKESDAQALMFLLDIDNFKKINDMMGHAFGDEVLRALGFGLAAEFRVSDILGRTGGDEFMIFLKNIKDQSIIDKEVNRVVRFFHGFEVGDVVKYSATASIGCAVYPRDADNFESLYKAADKALYRAKKRGKNQLAFYQNEPEQTKQESKL